MGVNEIHDGRDSLLTQRMENMRRVERREGHAGGGGREFQQFFEFAENENEEGEKRERKNTAPPPAPSVSRAVTKEEVEKAKSRDQLTLGQFIDVEA